MPRVRVCVECGREFTPEHPRSRAVVCGDTCRREHRRRLLAAREGREFIEQHPTPAVTGRAAQPGKGGALLYQKVINDDIDEFTTKQAQAWLGLAYSTVAEHIAEMTAVGLLERVHFGRYRVHPPTTPTALAYLRHIR